MKRRNILLCLSLVSFLSACEIIVYRNSDSPASETTTESVQSEISSESLDSQESTTPPQSETTSEEESTTPSQTEESTTPLETESASEEESESEESESEIPPEPVYPEEELDDKVTFEAKDGGNFYQANINNHLYDVIGYEENSDGLVSIKQKEYGPYTYLGMLYNRSIIDGLKSITVDFDDTKDLYIVFSEYLMEDMTFPTTSKIESGKKIQAGENKGYFVLYTNSTTKVDINSISIEYDDEQSFADSMLYTPENAFGGYARSAASKYSIGYDLIDVTNNPTANTNNYSEGTNPANSRPNRWHRWNGIYLGETETIGKTFSIHMTIIGNISQMIDPNNYFCYSVWPAFVKDGEDPYDINDGWSYIMIGNDDYEPLGKASPDAINKDYNSYAGRFLTLYSGEFDPDVDKIKDESKTFREAYDTYKLPFWNVEFVYDGNGYDVIVNGMNLGGYELYDEGKYNGENFAMKYLELHLVNYGQGLAGEHPYDPAPKYSGTFTMPRVEKDNNA